MERSFLKHAATYGLAMFLTQAGGFVLLPLYLRCLGPADFGVLEVAARLAETFAALLLFGGLRQALMAFYKQAADEPDRRRVVGATLLLIVGAGVLGGVVALLVGPYLVGWLAPDASFSGDLVRLAVIGILLEPLSFVGLVLMQARTESRAYMVVVIGQLLVRVAVSLALVRYLEWGVTGVLTANAIVAGLFGVALVVRELWRGAAWPEWAGVRAMLVFALPMLPGGLCFFLLNHGDRFFLLRHHGEEAVGQYALGYKLAMLVTTFSLSPLYMVWSSRMYDVANRKDASEVFGSTFVRILAAYLFVGLGLCLFAREVVELLGGQRYLPAVGVIPLVVLACFFQSMATLLDSVFYVKRRTELKLEISLASAAVMLALYWALIGPLGNLGAALATLGGFAFLAALTCVVSHRVFAVRYPWRRLTGLLLLAIGLYLVSLPLPAWALGAKSALLLVAPVIAWIAGLVSDDEKSFIVLSCPLASENSVEVNKDGHRISGRHLETRSKQASGRANTRGRKRRLGVGRSA